MGPRHCEHGLSVPIYDDDNKTGTLVTKVTANDKRNDLCTKLGSCNHGFSATLPDAWLTANPRAPGVHDRQSGRRGHALRQSEDPDLRSADDGHGRRRWYRRSWRERRARRALPVRTRAAPRARTRAARRSRARAGRQAAGQDRSRERREGRQRRRGRQRGGGQLRRLGACSIAPGPRPPSPPSPSPPGLCSACAGVALISVNGDRAPARNMRPPREGRGFTEAATTDYRDRPPKPLPTALESGRQPHRLARTDPGLQPRVRRLLSQERAHPHVDRRRAARARALRTAPELRRRVDRRRRPAVPPRGGGDRPTA